MASGVPARGAAGARSAGAGGGGWGGAATTTGRSRAQVTKTRPTTIITNPAHRFALTSPVLSGAWSAKSPISVRITPYAPIRVPMMLRMSSRPAVCRRGLLVELSDMAASSRR